MVDKQDKITLLTSKGKRLAKYWKRDNSIEAYEQAKHFRVCEIPVQNLGEFAKLLKGLSPNSGTCIVRGRYSGDNIENALRRNSEFEDQPLHVMCVDVDKSDCQNPKEFIEKYLPACFHNRSYVLQYTGSHGHPSREGLLSCHLWFWLSEPRTSAELKQWAERQKLNIDRALFNPVQIHYTSDPVMQLGLIDPLKSHRVQFIKDEADTVTLDDSRAELTLERPARAGEYFHDPVARAVTLENVTLETIGELRDAIESLDPERSYNRDEWVSVLQALASLKGTEYESMAYDMAQEFSQQSPEKYNEEDFERVWQSMEPDVVTYKSIFAKAQNDGWRNPKKQDTGIKEPKVRDRGNAAEKPTNTDRTIEIKKPIGDECVELDYEHTEIKRDKLVETPKRGNRDIIVETPKKKDRTEYPIEYPPGAAGQIAKYIFRSSRMPVKSFAIAGALSFLSHYNANMFYVDGSKTALNLYHCLVGDTGSGKEGPRLAIIRLIQAARNNPQAKVYDEVSSGTALMRSLVNNPNALVMLDEVGIYLQSALNSNGPSYQRETIKDLMRLFGQGRARLNGKLYADVKQNIGVIEHPYVNLLGTTTSIELLEGLNAKQINNGFLNRILVVEGAAPGRMQRRPDTDVPDEIIETLGRIHMVFNQDWENESIPLQYGEGAEERLDQLSRKGLNTHGPDMKNLWSRTEELTVRIAGLLAVGDGQVIKVRHVDWAWRYVTYCIDRFASMLSTRMVESPFYEMTLKCLHYIQHAQEYSNDTRFGRFCRHGVLPRGKLTQLMRLKPKELNEVIQHLLDSRLIKAEIYNKNTCFRISD